MPSCSDIYGMFRRKSQASAELSAAEQEIRLDLPMFFQEFTEKCAKAMFAPGNEQYMDELVQVGEAAGDICEMIDEDLGKWGDFKNLSIDMSDYDGRGERYRFHVANSWTSQDVTLELTREILEVIGLS